MINAFLLYFSLHISSYPNIWLCSMLEFFLFLRAYLFLLTVSVDVVLMVFFSQGKDVWKKEKDFFQIISSLGTPLYFLWGVILMTTAVLTEGEEHLCPLIKLAKNYDKPQARESHSERSELSCVFFSDRISAVFVRLVFSTELSWTDLDEVGRSYYTEIWRVSLQKDFS